MTTAERRRWQVLADAVLPGAVVDDRHVVEVGGSHDVLVMPGIAVLRVARSVEAAALLPRRLQLLARLDDLDLPFRVPVPLSDAVCIDGITAAALSWIPGQPRPRGSGGAEQLRQMRAAFDAVDITALATELDVPHAYAGRDRWAQLLTEEVVPRLPADVQEESLRRVQAAAALPSVPAGLVHGDLAGANMLWSDDGTLAGIIDWDLACAFDPAVDAACLAWFGWETIASIVDADTLARARSWFATFGLEQVSAAVLELQPEREVDAAVVRAAQWVRRTGF